MRGWWAALWLLGGLLPAAALAAPKAIVLYSFSGGTDGAQPVGPLVMDRASGVLYGTTLFGGSRSGYGTVFSLTPPAPGKTGWTEKVLVAFDSFDGAFPDAGLVEDGGGNLYGTTPEGGPWALQGMVFELVPPAPGMTRWREKALYRFPNGPDGWQPEGGLVVDADGNLYGTTEFGGRDCACGTVFRLAPPGGGMAEWTKTTLYRFRGARDGERPSGTLTIGFGGALYGSTAYGGKYGNGTVFSLAPPASAGSARTETVIHTFSSGAHFYYSPLAGVIAGANGDLFGTAPSQGTGVVFSLTPPGAGRDGWVYDVLHVFKGPDGALPHGLTAGPDGVLVGVAPRGGPYENGCDGAGCGVVFKLTPPEAGHTNWHEETVHAFRRRADGGDLRDALISDASGNLYGTTQYGGPFRSGTVFEIVP